MALDVWDVLSAIEAGDVVVLQRALAEGYPPNEACKYTGTTALLQACTFDNVEAVKLLLATGANPDLQHHDGYNTFDSSKSRAVREMILRAGFSLLLDERTEAAAVKSYRVLAPQPVNMTRTLTQAGDVMNIELARATFPIPAGDVIVRVPGLSEIRVAPGEHRTLPPVSGPLEIAAELVDFVGEFRFRLWDDALIAKCQGPRSFWLPAYDLP